MFIISNLRKFSNIRGGINPPKGFVSKYAFAFTTDQVAPLRISYIVGTQVRNIDTGEVVYTATSTNNIGSQISSALPIGQYEIINPNPTSMWLLGTGVVSVDDWGDIDAGIYTHIRLQSCSRLTSVPYYLPHSITNMNNMFTGTTPFNQDISNWDISNVTTMSQLFRGASSFNQYIGNWNTSNVTNMNNMFGNATSFNQDIGNWNTSNVTNMRAMFDSATSFNQNLSTWKVPKISSKPEYFDTGTTAWVKTGRQPRWGVA